MILKLYGLLALRDLSTARDGPSDAPLRARISIWGLLQVDVLGSHRPNLSVRQRFASVSADGASFYSTFQKLWETSH